MAGELVLPVLVLVVGVLAQPRDLGADDGRREQRLQCRCECVGVDALPLGVCCDPGGAEFGGVSCGSTVAKPMPSWARRDSSAAYPAKNRIIAFAPEYPPLSGEPRRAAPLDTATTRLPGVSGCRSAARIQWKACWVSTCQLRLNDSQTCSCTGPMAGGAPALSTSIVGWCCSIRMRAVSWRDEFIPI